MTGVRPVVQEQVLVELAVGVTGVRPVVQEQVLVELAVGVTGVRPVAQEQVLEPFPEVQPAGTSAVVDLGAGLRSSRRR